MDHLFEFAGNHYILVSLFLGLLAALFFQDKRRSGVALSPQQVTMLLNQGNALIVDLREQKEFSEGHITGAKHIPFSHLKERMTELPKEKMVILVDKAGQHTGMGGKMLRDAGYDKIGRMTGGIMEWKNQGLPLVKK